MVNHNYDLRDQKYGNLETFFCFPYLYNDSEKIKSAMNVRELKKLLKSKEISEDDEKSKEKIIQSITDDHIKSVDEKVSSKEKEIMTI